MKPFWYTTQMACRKQTCSLIITHIFFRSFTSKNLPQNLKNLPQGFKYMNSYVNEQNKTKWNKNRIKWKECSRLSFSLYFYFIFIQSIRLNRIRRLFRMVWTFFKHLITSYLIWSHLILYNLISTYLITSYHISS